MYLVSKQSCMFTITFTPGCVGLTHVRMLPFSLRTTIPTYLFHLKLEKHKVFRDHISITFLTKASQITKRTLSAFGIGESLSDFPRPHASR